MNRDVARKRPATVVGMRPRAPRNEVTVRDPSRARVVARLRQLAQQGHIGTRYVIGQVNGEWVAHAELLEDPPSWWKRNGRKLIIIGILVTILLALLAWAITAFITAVVAAIPYGIGLVILLAIGGILAGRQDIQVIQTVRIRR